MFKKIFTVIIISILMVSSVSIGSVKAATADAKFYFTGSTNLNQTCNTSIDLDVDPGSNQSNAANVIINYNPGQIDILDSDNSQSGIQVEPGNAYDIYANNTVDTIGGQINLTGFSINRTLNSPGLFARIHLKSKPSITSSSLTIVFSGVGQTLDSNVADATTSGDDLGSVQNVTLNFSPVTSCVVDTTGPVITPVNPQNFQTNVSGNLQIQAQICDPSGVNLTSIDVNIDGTDYTNTSPQFSYTAQGNCFNIDVASLTPVTPNQMSTIVFKASDLLGNPSSLSVVFNVPPEANNCNSLIQQAVDSTVNSIVCPTQQSSTPITIKADDALDTIVSYPFQQVSSVEQNTLTKGTVDFKITDLPILSLIILIVTVLLRFYLSIKVAALSRINTGLFLLGAALAVAGFIIYNSTLSEVVMGGYFAFGIVDVIKVLTNLPKKPSSS